MKKRLILSIILAICVALNIESIFASEKQEIGIIDNDKEYIIFFEDQTEEFKYAFSNDLARPDSSVFENSRESSSKNQVIAVKKGIEESCKYLWTEGLYEDYEGIQVGYSNSVSTLIIETVANMTRKIDVISGKDSVTIIDKSYDNYYYQLVKAVGKDTSSDYNVLVALAEAVNTTGITGKIMAAKNFYNKYISMSPSVTDSNWIPVPENNIIEEPPYPETEDGDVYVLWIMGEKSGEKLIDTQFMFSIAGQEVIKQPTKVLEKIKEIVYEVRRGKTIELDDGETLVSTKLLYYFLPKTGASLILEVLFIINVTALVVVMIKRKRLDNLLKMSREAKINE